ASLCLWPSSKNRWKAPRRRTLRNATYAKRFPPRARASKLDRPLRPRLALLEERACDHNPSKPKLDEFSPSCSPSRNELRSVLFNSGEKLRRGNQELLLFSLQDHCCFAGSKRSPRLNRIGLPFEHDLTPRPKRSETLVVLLRIDLLHVAVFIPYCPRNLKSENKRQAR